MCSPMCVHPTHFSVISRTCGSDAEPGARRQLHEPGEVDGDLLPEIAGTEPEVVQVTGMHQEYGACPPPPMPVPLQPFTGDGLHLVHEVRRSVVPRMSWSDTTLPMSG
jgi:hypothetical protein